MVSNGRRSAQPRTLLAGVRPPVLAIGIALPLTPLAGTLGFTPLPWSYFIALTVLVVAYLALIEVAKGWFYGTVTIPTPSVARGRDHQVHRRASRFSVRRL